MYLVRLLLKIQPFYVRIFWFVHHYSQTNVGFLGSSGLLDCQLILTFLDWLHNLPFHSHK